MKAVRYLKVINYSVLKYFMISKLSGASTIMAIGVVISKDVSLAYK